MGPGDTIRVRGETAGPHTTDGQSPTTPVISFIIWSVNSSKRRMYLLVGVRLICQY